MEAAILATMDEVDRLGGMVRCVENGAIQRMIADEAYRSERAISSGSRLLSVSTVTRARRPGNYTSCL